MKKNMGITDKWIHIVIGIATGALFICHLGFQREESNHRKCRGNIIMKRR